MRRTSTRKVADCKNVTEGGCTLTISGEEQEVLDAAARPRRSAHGHDDNDELHSSSST